MTYTKLNSIPTIETAVESITTPSVSINSGSWANFSKSLPSKPGYKPIAITKISPASPSSMVLIYFYLNLASSTPYVEARFRNMTSSTQSWDCTFEVLYMKLT